MCRIPERMRSGSCRTPARRSDDGFTLAEVLVALSLLALAAAALVPLVVMSFKTALAAKLSTQAKNVAQERVEQMRDLPFHVDRQNGPFLDLLDEYYPDLSASGTPRVPGASAVGYVGAGAGTGGEPTGAFYRVTFAAVPGYPLLSQVIDVQFLALNRTSLTPAATYDSQVEGRDQPPSLLVGVTVLTKWTAQGSTKVYRSFSEVADGRGLTSTLTAQARVSVVKVGSSTTDGSTLAAEAGVVNVDGAQSVGSTASIEARSATADLSPIAGSTLSPVHVNGDGGVVTSPGGGAMNLSPSPFIAGGSGCGFAAAGRGSIGADYTPSTTSGIPTVPTTAGSGDTPVTTASASLMANGGSCGVFQFGNAGASSVPIMSSPPLLSVPNPPGNAAVLTGNAWLNGTSVSADPHKVRSGASLSMTQTVDLFASPLVAANGPVVRVTVTSALLSCSASVPSGGTPTQSATGSYSAQLSYWRAGTGGAAGAYVATPFAWNSSTQSGSTDPLASVDLNAVVGTSGATTYKLGDYISQPRSIRLITEGRNGLHLMNGIISLASAPGAPPISVQVGVLSCVADDVR